MRNYVRLWLFFSPTIFSRAPRLSRHSAGDTIGELRLLPLANEMKYLQQQKKSKWKYGEISTQRVFWEMQIVFELLYSEYCDSISNRWRNRYVSTHFFLSLPFHLYFCELFHSSFSTMFPCGIMRFEITESRRRWRWRRRREMCGFHLRIWSQWIGIRGVRCSRARVHWMWNVIITELACTYS